jgi:hypothetical protein
VNIEFRVEMLHVLEFIHIEMLRGIATEDWRVELEIKK